jgi:predicted secreted acid phosphatase
MRRFISLLAFAGALVFASPAMAQLAPPPKLIVTRIDHVPMVELYDGGGGLPYLGSSTSYNAGDWENALRAYAKNGDPDSVYMNQIAQVDTVAQRTIDRVARRARAAKAKAARLARHGHGHGHGHGSHGQKAKKPAVVLDIDETSLSNYSAISADNFTFGPQSMAEGTNEIGKAIPATLKLFNDAKARGIAVFFITGRGEASRAHTESNLTREGYSGWKQLYLKPVGSTLTTVAYKSGARQDIESQGYKIIANVGDQYSDLAGGHAAVAYKLANPFYFLP